MLCLLTVGAKPKCNFQVSIKIQILVIENFCVYYCVCIEGIFKHQGHYKSIIAKTFKILSKKERTMCQSLGSVVGGRGGGKGFP